MNSRIFLTLSKQTQYFARVHSKRALRFVLLSKRMLEADVFSLSFVCDVPFFFFFCCLLDDTLFRQRFPAYNKKRKEALSKFREELGDEKPESPFLRSHFSMLPNGWTPPPSMSSSPSSSEDASMTTSAPLTSPFLTPSSSLESDGNSLDGSVPTPSLPYKVLRTSRGFLPVYTDYRRGKQKTFTLVRLIRGDMGALKKELELLIRQPFEEKNGYIRTKGNKKRQIVEWLHQLGF